MVLTTADYGYKGREMGGAREVFPGRLGQRHMRSRLLRNLTYQIRKHSRKTTKKGALALCLTATLGFFACSSHLLSWSLWALGWVEGLEETKRPRGWHCDHGRKCS